LSVQSLSKLILEIMQS